MTQEGFHATLTDDEDDHGQAQPQLASAFFGRLVTLGLSNEQDLRLVLPVHTVGRVDSCSLVLRYPFVSSVHARIRCGPEGISIEDFSTNGLWINGAKLSAKATVSLGHNDEVAFAPPRAEGDMSPPLRFTFTAPPPPAAAAPVAAAEEVDARVAHRCSEEHRHPYAVAGAAASSSESEPLPPPPPAAAGNEEEEGEKHLVCGICQDLLYRPVSAQPCLHNFCSACYSSWMARSDNCPECRQAVRMVARNHLLASIVDEFVLKHPHKQRDAAERARMDSEDKIGSEPTRVGSKRRRDDESDASDDYSDDDEDGPGAHGIHPAEWMGMHPALVAAHIAAGHVQMSPCACCDRVTPAPLLASLRDRHASALPARCLGNPSERQILLEYLQQQGISTNEMLQDCLGRAAAGTFELATSSGGAAVAVDVRTCHACYEAVFSTLCYQYRAAIPPARLPAGVTSRQDCWYGRDCRTQRTKPTHAERLNHICQPMERGKGGKGKGGGGKGSGGGKGAGGGGGMGACGGGAAAAAAGVAAGAGPGAGDAAGA